MPRVLVSTKNSGAASASAAFSVATSQRVSSRQECTVCEPVGSSSRTMIFGFMIKASLRQRKPFRAYAGTRLNGGPFQHCHCALMHRLRVHAVEVEQLLRAGGGF